MDDGIRDDLLRRVGRLEDESEIRNLIASYGPYVDHGDAEAVAAIWLEDGVYEVDAGGYDGRTAIAAMVRSPAHQGLIAGGCAHVLGPLHVAVTGDTATATGYSLLISAEPEQHVVRRASANHWTLERTAEGWRVRLRTNRRLDGAELSHALLAGGVAGPAQPAGS